MPGQARPGALTRSAWHPVFQADAKETKSDAPVPVPAPAPARASAPAARGGAIKFWRAKLTGLPPRCTPMEVAAFISTKVPVVQSQVFCGRGDHDGPGSLRMGEAGVTFPTRELAEQLEALHGLSPVNAPSCPGRIPPRSTCPSEHVFRGGWSAQTTAVGVTLCAECTRRACLTPHLRQA